jgi:site-specific DNA-methyltransferase (adenine-specific)
MGDLFGDYAPLHEIIIFGNRGKNLKYGRDPNVLEFSKTKNDLHPTEKPKDLFQYLIKKSSNKNDLIFDPFGGSFTTARAAKDLGRKWISCDLEKEYCEIGENRMRQENLF